MSPLRVATNPAADTRQHRELHHVKRFRFIISQYFRASGVKAEIRGVFRNLQAEQQRWMLFANAGSLILQSRQCRHRTVFRLPGNKACFVQIESHSMAIRILAPLWG
eukprot:jgi/Ulvmu1/4661/UM002_0392.1